MDEDYEICVKEMRAFFEKPRKLGVLPRMVKVRKDGERDPLQRKSSSSSDVLSVASSSSSSSSGNSSGSLSPSPPPTDSCSPSLESIQQKADEIEVVDLLPTATGTGGDANNKPAPPPEHRQRHKSSQDSECSSDEFLGASSDSSSSASSTTNNGAHSDDAASAASDDDDRHSGGLGVSMLGDLGGKNVVVCYRGPYIEQEEEREVLCNINNAFLTKKKLTQAQQMLKLLRTAEKGILANREDLERRVAEAAEQLQEQGEEQQEDDKSAAEGAKLQANLDDIHRMIEKTEAIVEHYSRKFQDFKESGDARGIEDLFE